MEFAGDSLPVTGGAFDVDGPVIIVFENGMAGIRKFTVIHPTGIADGKAIVRSRINRIVNVNIGGFDNSSDFIPSGGLDSGVFAAPALEHAGVILGLGIFTGAEAESPAVVLVGAAGDGIAGDLGGPVPLVLGAHGSGSPGLPGTAINIVSTHPDTDEILSLLMETFDVSNSFITVNIGVVLVS